jgi:CheY-like chemotaxis protein
MPPSERVEVRAMGIRHRILLVDDDADGRYALACFLNVEGVDVSTASDGREALDLLGTDLVHCLIVLDLDMVGMDGWEFRRRQLLWREMAGIPIIVLSGHAELKAVTRGMQAREIWKKPVALDQLLRAVTEHCRGH